MATCKQTAYELIQDVFSPCVAVLCSSDVETVCAKNNLTFVEMVQPFCRLNTEITIRDPANVPFNIKNLRVVMKSMHSQPPALAIGKKMMHDAVSSNILPPSDSVLCNSVNTEIYKFKYPAATPWFEAYRDVFFQLVSPTEHEFMHHYLSCIFVVSSSHHDPLSQINDLCQQQAQHQLQNSQYNSRWFFSYIFKYYVLVHDTSSENLAKAEAVYQSMKSSFGGSSCHLLQINSASEIDRKDINSHEEMNGTLNIPDPWSQFLAKYCLQQDFSTTDHVETNSDNFSYHTEDCLTQLDDARLNSNSKDVTISHPLLNSSEDITLVNDTVLGKSNKDFIVRTSSLNSGFWSKKSNLNKRHGLCLTLSDMDRIKVFVQEFCIHGLVPFVEKQIRILNDQVANRKSIHRTIFGVTKKFFAGNKPGVQSPTTSLNSVVYSQDAPELQVRKLGDLAFMFQLFEVAYQAYHTAKRDFSGDQAWLYFAGASEMAALSVFMQGNSALHEYPARYMETAIVTYLNTCKFQELATRATFLSTECLKTKGLYRDAALQFIRMPSEADLPSALCLEQAAYCFINCKPPKIRKYAFHMILAGHRFSKAGQKKHALRAYKQAERVYGAAGWNFANNHINAMTGRFSAHLNQLENACLAFKMLLSAPSYQPAMEQASYLKDYLHALKQLLCQKSPEDSYELPFLPVPVINSSSIKVLLCEDNIVNEDGSLIVQGRGFALGDSNNDIWTKLEEIVLSGLHKNMPLYTPQLQCLTANTDNSNRPIAVVNEIISVEINIRNPLSIPLTMENIFLLWAFTSGSECITSCNSSSISNELDFSKAMLLNSTVQTEVIPNVTIEPLQEIKLCLTLKPQQIGDLLIRGIAYSLLSQLNTVHTESEKKQDNSLLKPSVSLSLQGKQTIELKGPRLNRTVSEKASKLYAPDYRLSISVVSPMPKLQVRYHTFPSTLYCGEVFRTMIEFSNVGQANLNKIVIASPTPGLFALGLDGEVDNSFQIYKEVPCNGQYVPVLAEWEHCDWKIEVQMPDGQSIHLSPGESITFPLWLRGPDTAGDHDLNLLFYYESDCPHSKLRYRLLQHASILHTLPSVNFQASAMKSYSFEEKYINNFPSSSANSLVLSLIAGNISKELSEVTINQISCVSRKWSLCFSDDTYQNGFPVIHPQEVLYLTLKAVSLSPKVAVSSQKVMVFSHLPMGRSQVDSSATPCSDFSCRSQLNLPDFLSLDTKRLTAENEKQNEENELKELEKSMLLLLTVIWKARIQRNNEIRIVTGQHHVSIEQLNNEETNNIPSVQYDDSAYISERRESIPHDASTADQLIKCSLRHPFHAQHNFKLRRIKIVPVEFVAHNTSNTETVITLNTSQPTRIAASIPEGNQSSVSQQFTWVYGIKREITLKPDETVHIPLQASFCGPGTYNLSTMHVSIKCSEETAINYAMSPYLIVISACDLPIN